jgi:hypothetical protein
MSATLPRKGVGRIDLRFRESDLAQQLVKARVAPCAKAALEPARGGGGGQGRSRGGGETQTRRAAKAR